MQTPDYRLKLNKAHVSLENNDLTEWHADDSVVLVVTAGLGPHALPSMPSPFISPSLKAMVLFTHLCLELVISFTRP